MRRIGASSFEKGRDGAIRIGEKIAGKRVLDNFRSERSKETILDVLKESLKDGIEGGRDEALDIIDEVLPKSDQM